MQSDLTPPPTGDPFQRGGMTTRERLNRVRRRSFLVAIPGFIIFAASGAASQSHPAFTGGIFLGFALFGGSIVYTLFAGRCVHCRRRLGQIFSQSGGGPMLRISPDLKFCPYCGVSLDEPPKDYEIFRHDR